MSLYTRVLLKLSGEIVGGAASQGLDKEAIHKIATEVRDVAAAGFEVAVVIGAGNFLRGSHCENLGIERTTADYMGMLATLLNGLALQSAVEAMGYPTRVMSAIDARQVVEPYIRRRALRHMEKGRVVILAGGTGNPYCTTDTAAALRATELNCDVLLKATKVDGIYSADPAKDPTAKRYERLTYKEALDQELRVMDATAFTLCRENDMPIIVYSFREPGTTLRVVRGEPVGTIVDGK